MTNTTRIETMIKNLQNSMESRFTDMEGRFDGLIEVISVMQKDIQEMKPMVNRIPFIEQDIEDIKKVNGIQSRWLKDHESRILFLERRPRGALP